MAKDRPLPSAAQLEAAAARLRPREREVLFLAAGERLSNEAIAARLGLSARGAERLLARALRKLDRMLDAPTGADRQHGSTPRAGRTAREASRRGRPPRRRAP